MGSICGLGRTAEEAVALMEPEASAAGAVPKAAPPIPPPPTRTVTNVGNTLAEEEQLQVVHV